MDGVITRKKSEMTDQGLAQFFGINPDEYEPGIDQAEDIIQTNIQGGNMEEFSDHHYQGGTTRSEKRAQLERARLALEYIRITYINGNEHFDQAMVDIQIILDHYEMGL